MPSNEMQNTEDKTLCSRIILSSPASAIQVSGGDLAVPFTPSEPTPRLEIGVKED